MVDIGSQASQVEEKSQQKDHGEEKSCRFTGFTPFDVIAVDRDPRGLLDNARHAWQIERVLLRDQLRNVLIHISNLSYSLRGGECQIIP